jgi:hypothetical protein
VILLFEPTTIFRFELEGRMLDVEVHGEACAKRIERHGRIGPWARTTWAATTFTPEVIVQAWRS